jgi:hypothetical protein
VVVRSGPFDYHSVFGRGYQVTTAYATCNMQSVREIVVDRDVRREPHTIGKMHHRSSSQLAVASVARQRLVFGLLCFRLTGKWGLPLRALRVAELQIFLYEPAFIIITKELVINHFFL